VANRYLFLDDYAKADLKAHLESLSPQERIEFLVKLTAVVPRTDRHAEVFEEFLVADPSAAVRAWAARTFGFKKLTEDREPLVRAAWHEYQDGLRGIFRKDHEQVEEFLKLSQLERLAWIRNRWFPDVLVRSIFDLSNEKLSLSEMERSWLIASFLTGNGVLLRGNEGGRNWRDSTLAEELWKLAASWPPHPSVFSLLAPQVFEHVIIFDDECRATTLAAVTDPEAKLAIAEHAGELSDCLVALRHDGDTRVRELAWKRFHFKRSLIRPEVDLIKHPDRQKEYEKHDWRSVLECGDLWTLAGLCANESIPPDVRQKEVAPRMFKLVRESDSASKPRLDDLSNAVTREADQAKLDALKKSESAEAWLRILHERVQSVAVWQVRGNVGILVLLLWLLFRTWR
jgi:hypothetical protein